MLTLAPFTFCANNVPGTDPIRAMDMARRCGFHTIELSAIDGISEQIVAERVSTGYVAQIERELQNVGREKTREICERHLKEIEEGKRDFRF